MISPVTGRTHVVDDRADGDFEYQPHRRASARADGLLPDSDSFTIPSPQFAYFSFLKHRNFAEVDEKGPCRQPSRLLKCGNPFCFIVSEAGLRRRLHRSALADYWADNNLGSGE